MAAVPRATHVARVRSRLSEWRRIGASARVLRWLSEGVRIPWNERGPPAPFHHGVATFSPAERAWLTVERERCLLTGAWRRARSRRFVSRAFVVYHKGKPRLVIDLRWINLHTLQRSCKFESLSTLRRMLRRGDWLWSCDLTDAYHHVGIHDSDVQYFTFGIQTLDGEEFFETPALNFGWTLSPYVFTEVMKAPVGYLRNPASAGAPRYGVVMSTPRRQGVRTLPWLDDFLFSLTGDATYSQACEARDWSFGVFRRLGLSIAEGKGQHDPSHFLRDHLGFGIDSARGLFLLTSRREASLAHGAHSLLQTAAARARRVNVRTLAAFAGLGEASSLALPLARFMLRALYDDLSTRRGWRGSVLLSGQTLADLRWWASLRNSRHVGRAIWRSPETRTLDCDASDLGWGGALDVRRPQPPSAAPPPPPPSTPPLHPSPTPPTHPPADPTSAPPRPSPHSRHVPAHGFWAPHELPWHITLKELVAVRLSVQHFLRLLVGRRVLLREDNMAVVHILTSFVSRSPALMLELRRLWYLLDAHDIDLRPLWISTTENVIADYASRLAFSGDYALARPRFEFIMGLWGWCTVDAFASPATAQLPRYWTRAPIAGAEAIDAFAQEWRGECLWVHPPPSLLPAVVQMLETTGARAYVCAPLWAGASWYGALLSLSAARVSLPPASLRPVAGDAPPRLQSWPVTVFRVDGGRATR